jgi:glycosyltransferase involved in cell wall biosynthesis
VVNYAFLSAFPPTESGVATFCAALMNHLADPASGEHCGVVPVVDGPGPHIPHDRVVRLISGQPFGALRVADALNRFDVVIIQIEEGLYGGLDGEDLLDVLAGVTVPVIAVLHTVSAAPTPHQRFVVQRIADTAAAVVVLSRSAAIALLEAYPISANRVTVIPHGAVAGDAARPAGTGAGPPIILTWGLLAPCKGIEWAIAALAQLRDLRPMPRYRVVGRTDPRVLAQHGESYRDFLHERARSSGMSALVDFNPAYRASDQLTSMVRDADLVLLPYDSPEQFVSGALSEAVAARRPVVATDFPYARELLAGGAGLVVPRRDPGAMAHAVRRVLTEPGLAETLTGRCTDLARALDWRAVAHSYRALARAVLV